MRLRTSEVTFTCFNTRSGKREAGAGVEREAGAGVEREAGAVVEREARAGVKRSCRVLVSSMKQALETSAGVWAAICLTCVVDGETLVSQARFQMTTNVVDRMLYANVMYNGKTIV